MAKLRWGADAPHDTMSARQRLLDAAESSFQRYGAAKTTIEDVAAAANVSRATVYRYFADRDELILGVLLREANRFLDRLTAEIDREPDFDRALINGVLFTVDAVRADQNLALLFTPDAIGITTSVAGASAALFSLTTDFLRPFFRAAQEAGRVRADIDLDEAAEWTLRAVLSLLTVRGPVGRMPAEQHRFLTTFLVPAFVVAPATRSPRSSSRGRAAPRKATARRG